jgi:hypothetical protein
MAAGSPAAASDHAHREDDTMKLIAAALPAGLVALVLSGLSGERPVERVTAIDASGTGLLRLHDDALPPWHPPVSSGSDVWLPQERSEAPRGHARLPSWHPPVSGSAKVLPNGHPVCPAGRAQPDRDGSRRGPLGTDDAQANPVIRI